MEKEFINCIEDGGVKKYVIQEGNGASPQYGYSCKMHYTGTLSDGTQFDQNLQIDKPFKFALGKGQVVKGLDIGIATMTKGEKAIFQITSDYGYGIEGLPPKIPGAQTLIFEVLLIEINVPKKIKSETSIIEREEIAMKLKDQGNQEFVKQSYQKALKRYKQALDFAQYSNSDEINENLTPLRINIQLNIAQTSLNLKDFTQAIEYTTKIINSLEATKQQMVKALFRRGVARAHINLLDEAQSDFAIGLEIDPNNNDLITQSSQVAKKINLSKKNEKAFYTKAFAQSSNKHDLEQNSQYSDPSNPWVFLDIQIGDEKSEKIGIELFQNHAPKTIENFLNLCTGDKGVGQKGVKLHYKNSRFHRLMKNFMIQGGDFTNGDGSGGESIFGKKFDDENLKCKHLKRGYLSMANSGPNTNGSQFFIIFKETPWLDGKHVVFGVVRLNIEFLDKLEVEEVGHKDLPDRQIVILDCGLLVL